MTYVKFSETGSPKYAKVNEKKNRTIEWKPRATEAISTSTWGCFASSGDISPRAFIVGYSWRSPAAGNVISKARAVLLHLPSPRRAPHTPACWSFIPRLSSPHTSHPLRYRVLHSPEPLMCADTRDRPPPRLAAAWWRSRPTRIDAHRTFANADGTIDAARHNGRRRWRRAPRAGRSARSARTTDHARPRPRESFPPRATRQRGKKRRKTCAFIYGTGASRARVIGRRRPLSRSRCVQLNGMSAALFRACDERARNQWIDQPRREGNAALSPVIPRRRSTAAIGVE